MYDPISINLMSDSMKHNIIHDDINVTLRRDTGITDIEVDLSQVIFLSSHYSCT